MTDRSSGRRSIADHASAVEALLTPALARRPAVRMYVHELVARACADEALAPLRLAADVPATAPLPGFDNSAMDGFAVRLADIAGAADGAPVTVPVAAPVAAGAVPTAHRPGTAVPVMTGAPLPVGADAVVKVEDVLPPRFDTPHVTIASLPEAGANIRRTGEDVEAGGLLLPAGTPLTPAAFGALAAAGITEIDVVEPARVLVVTTGTELVSARQQEPVTDATNVAGAASDDDATHDGSTAVPLSDAAAPARIRDANAISLTMALVEVGATAMHCSITDTPGALLDVVSAAASTADLVITTGGISMGAFEVVKQALAAPTGGQAWFGKVALQPGGPQGLGTVAGLPFVALPGNPVSALVSFELFVRPVLARAHGGPPQRRRHMAPLAGPLDSRRGIRQLRWGSIDIDGRVHVDRAGSHLLVHFARASVLVIVPENVVHLAAGDQVECWEIP